MLERDKAALDVRGQQALPADNQSDNESSRAGDDAGGSQGREQYNGGEAGHTQEVLKLEDHWATLLMGCRKWSLRCRVVALVDKR